MESESIDQNDILQQLKTLRAQKEFLEKRMFVLNECLSSEELKTQISNLEKKKELIIVLENAIKQLRTEIEPLQFLKSILEDKLKIENQTNKIGSKSSNDKELYRSKSTTLNNINELDSLIPLLKLTDAEVLKSLNSTAKNVFGSTQTLLNDKAESEAKSNSVFLSQELIDADDLFSSTQTPVKVKSVSSENNSIDECMQLLDQYDIVSDQEVINILNEVCME